MPEKKNPQTFMFNGLIKVMSGASRKLTAVHTLANYNYHEEPIGNYVHQRASHQFSTDVTNLRWSVNQSGPVSRIYADR